MMRVTIKVSGQPTTVHDVPDGESFTADIRVGSGSQNEVWEHECECGAITGRHCRWRGPRSAMRRIEYVPERLRSSYAAGGIFGSWPLNGAERIWVAPECAKILARNKWVTEVEQ